MAASNMFDPRREKTLAPTWQRLLAEFLGALKESSFQKLSFFVS